MRILGKADELFRQFGSTKTTVVDIATELGMSPANIYKFFPSKNALVEAAAERRLIKMKMTLTNIAHGRQTASERISRLARSVFRFHRECFRHEKQIYKLVTLATEENWKCVREFRGFISKLIYEIILDGVQTREFKATDAREKAGIFLDCLAWIINPLLFSDLKPDQVGPRLRAQMHFLTEALQ